MTTEVTRRGEFPKFVTYHVLCYINRNKLIPVVHGDRMSDEIGRDHTCTRPCLDDCLLATLILGEHFRFQLGFNLWSFF